MPGSVRVPVEVRMPDSAGSTMFLGRSRLGQGEVGDG
jgi:hypothetical protein